MEKNSEPASEAAMQASPHMLTAWADTSRENGDGARKRGSVVAILGAEGTAAPSAIPGLRTRIAPQVNTALHPERLAAGVGTMGRWLRRPPEPRTRWQPGPTTTPRSRAIPDAS